MTVSPQPPQYTHVIVQRPPANALGIIGFILSLIGLAGICIPPVGLLAVIGVILSFIGLFRAPRGLAIAGLLVGLLGSLFVAFYTVLFIMFGIASAAGFGQFVPRLECLVDFLQIQQAVATYRATKNTYPTTLEDLTSLDQDAKVDHWGHPYHFSVDVQTGEVTLLSDGADGIAGNDDDIKLPK
jgi:membrane-bound ClpP family serine protease